MECFRATINSFIPSMARIVSTFFDIVDAIRTRIFVDWSNSPRVISTDTKFDAELQNYVTKKITTEYRKIEEFQSRSPKFISYFLCTPEDIRPHAR